MKIQFTTTLSECSVNFNVRELLVTSILSLTVCYVWVSIRGTYKHTKPMVSKIYEDGSVNDVDSCSN